jgi:tetratricopeptide (TPR) repeat protein
VHFDRDTKLPVRFKQWLFTKGEGKPLYGAEEMTYGPPVDDRLFQLEVPEGVKVVSAKELAERDEMITRAGKLYEAGNYTEAMEAYQKVYDSYPRWCGSADALMMIGICYSRRDDDDLKAIPYYEKAVQELRYWEQPAIYFYLASAYHRTGQITKAIDALRNCLRCGEGVNDPQGFPLSGAKRWLAELEAADPGRDESAP